jgi:GrpB-like predicted nucleotidyltransferase (UPF0157 family)
VSDGVELVGGPEAGKVEVVAYDLRWVARFEHERSRILETLGPAARRIDHVGSTAVEDLCAKPIVDIDVSVQDPADEGVYLPALERAGYRLRIREPGHRMLRTRTRDVHVHIGEAGSPWERRHLLFRDWLRTSEPDRRLYSAVKMELATCVWADTNDYAKAKNDVIRQITARAESWARATAWALD